MTNFKRIIDFYIDSSIHVAFSCYALVQMTGFMFNISNIEPTAFFAFFGTIVGYNFVKYDALIRAKKQQIRKELKVILIFSLVAFVAVLHFFFQLQTITQIVAVVFLGLIVLYTLPFFPNRKNARNWAGVKIYIVALCWVGVTVFLPIFNAKIAVETNFIIIAIQRFLLIFVLVLIFEIIDLKNDDPHLQTVPQQIGVKQTKILGFFLLLVLIILEFFNANLNYAILFLKVVVALAIILFLYFASEKRSKYYTSFWVESVPIFWWILLLIFGQLF